MFQVLKLSKCIFLFCLFLFLYSVEGTESVRFLFTSENKPETVFLFPGRVSLFSFPCPITKALIGSPNDIKAEVDKLHPSDVHILLKKWRSEPSNLILKCKKDTVFLFSLIPAKATHYDYVKVLGHVSSKPLKVKSALPNSPLPSVGGLREGKDFTIRRILDFSWESEK
ncbi:MAG: hypothetical protein OXM55_07495 [Bdellovibrionales bacterium]|nr:hypothetical protein [Bdellovibrionales bacterium]